MSERTRVLAIDFGTVRIGLALSDPTRTLASPLTVIRAGTTAIQEIAHLAMQHEAGEIMIGLPLSVDGSDSDMTRRVRAFAQQIGAAIPLPVVLYDERYSSMIAQEHMIEAGYSRKTRRKKGEVDKRAAAAMLQEYLDSGTNRG